MRVQSSLFVLALTLACAPERAGDAAVSDPIVDPSAIPEQLEPIVARWQVGVERMEASAKAEHRLMFLWSGEFSESESAEFEACRAAARADIAAASPDDRMWLRASYLRVFWFGIDQPSADAVLEIPPDHPAWAAETTGLFRALAVSAEPQRLRAYVEAVEASHGTPHLRAGLAYLELQAADRAHDWDRARVLYQRLQSPDLARTEALGQMSAGDSLDPDRLFRPERRVPELCAAAIAGPEAGSVACLNDLFPHPQHTLLIGFATWCGPCREQLPEVVELARRRPLRVIMINHHDADAELAREYLRSLGVEDWTVLHMTLADLEQRAFGGAFDLVPIPYLALIDEAGVIQAGPPWFDPAALAEIE